MATDITIVYVPVPAGYQPRPQRLSDLYEFTCTCGNPLELAGLDGVSCLSCRKTWHQIVWEQEAVEDERPAVCPNPDCPHDAG